MSDSVPSLRGNSAIESANRDIAVRSLRESKSLGGDNYAASLEERGYFTNWFGFKIDLQTISDKNLAKILNNEDAKLKAFKYLKRRDVNALAAYSRLGGPNLADDGVRMKFWKEYGPWYDSRTYGNY
ncbi:Secreted RxLR effector peptide protein [Phytophthora palmivora]|uniref:Secreted RxLR effector peptide protein n=1 Tax=Phytophthora palmivora TaxID=4796 RepID=A0A2P4X3P9_9STRA|nr:Secreted RxLR effector peptide protein [Phytophthora palmivora]